MANLRNLTATEEQVIIKYILELVARGFCYDLGKRTTSYGMRLMKQGQGCDSGVSVGHVTRDPAKPCLSGIQE